MRTLTIGNGRVSIDVSDRPGTETRIRYHWTVSIPAGEFSGDDLQSGCQGGDLDEGMASLLSFLGAAAESYAYRMRTGRTGENEDLFPAPVVEWAYQYSDEIWMSEAELTESQY